MYCLFHRLQKIVNITITASRKPSSNFLICLTCSPKSQKYLIKYIIRQNKTVDAHISEANLNVSVWTWVSFLKHVNLLSYKLNLFIPQVLNFSNSFADKYICYFQLSLWSLAILNLDKMCVCLLAAVCSVYSRLYCRFSSTNNRFCKSCKWLLSPVDLMRATLHLSPQRLPISVSCLKHLSSLKTGDWGQTLDIWHQGKLKTIQILLPQLPLNCRLCFWHLYVFSAGGKLPGVCSSAKISGWCERLWGSGRSCGPHDWNHREGEFGCINTTHGL